MKAPGHAMIVLTGGFLEVGKTERGGSHPLVVLLFCPLLLKKPAVN